MFKKFIIVCLILIYLSSIFVSADGTKVFSYADLTYIIKNAYSNNYGNYNPSGVYNINSSAFANDSNYEEVMKGVQKAIPALMYHKVTDNPLEATEYVVTGTMLEEDFAEIKARGYNPITVAQYYKLVELYKNLSKDNNCSKLAEFFKNNPKPIIITFDDGYKGIYTHVLPLMIKYGFNVSFYICGELIDTHNPQYCSWAEIKALVDSGLANIGNHTYSLHNKTKSELESLYISNIEAAIEDINRNKEAIEKNIGIVPTGFSFPYGQYNSIILTRMKAKGYTELVSTDYRVNRIADGKTTLGRVNRPGNQPTKQFFDDIELKCK